jgi:SAM-dependent methyltransferase
MSPAQPNTLAVGAFYDQHSDAFSKTYGEVLQSFRTADIADLLTHEAEAMGITGGMRLLDAGCGTAGPAIYFARHNGLHIDAITASGIQAQLATEKVIAAGVADKVFVRQGDYHYLEHYYPQGIYDIIYYLESFGHSKDPERAIASAWNCLKPGGRLYIKDLFIKEASTENEEEAIRRNIARINEAYCYTICDLYDILRRLRRRGFVLAFLKSFDLSIEIFQTLAVVNEFQQLTGVNAIDDLLAYTFPIDFLELLCVKPTDDPPPEDTDARLKSIFNVHVRRFSPHGQASPI